MSTTVPTRRKLLFVLTKAPYGSSLAAEALDAILVAAIFEQEVSVLYSDDGIFQLLKNQHAQELSTRNQGKASRVLPEYDVEKIFVDADALKSRGLSVTDLVLPATCLESREISNLISQQHAVLNF